MESTSIVRAYFSPLGRMRMLGGAAALDLANTLHWRDGALADFIPGYEELIAWCVPARLLSEAEARALKRKAKTQPELAQKIHGEVAQFRAALKDWFLASAHNLQHGAAPSARAKAAIRKAIAKAGGPAALAEIMNAAGADDPLMLPLRRCAMAAAMLLLFPPSGEIRQCEADHCGGFFINDSRAKPRRWCSMDGCGNRAKAARFRKAHAGG